MSSLVDSIFGNSGSAAASATTEVVTTTTASAAALDSIFATKIDLPAAREYPVLKKKRKVSSAAAAVADNSNNDGNKKQRKSKKTDEEIAAAKAAEDAMIGPKQNPAVLLLQEEEEEDNNNNDVDERTVFVGNLPLHYTRRALQKLFADCGRMESTRIRSVAAAGVKLPPSQKGNQNLVKKVCSNTGQLDASAKHSVLGYVVFCDQESVAAALLKNHLAVPDESSDNNNNNAAGGKMKNHKTAAVRHIRVDRVSEPVKDPSRSVFVGNLPYAADEESLAKHFAEIVNLSSSAGNKNNSSAASTESVIEGVRIVRDKDTQLCKGFGYILFKDSSMAALALAKCSSQGGESSNNNNKKYMQKVLRVQVCGKRTKNQKGATTKPKAVSRRKAELADSVGALKRVLTRQLVAAPRKRAERKKSSKPGPKASGGGNKSSAKKANVSKRAASEAKTGKRIKKIEKRLTKGMGKTRAK